MCFAHERLKKIGVSTFDGESDGTQLDIFARAMLQAKRENNDVAVYLEGEGLFVVAPDKMANDLTHCMYMFEMYKNKREAYRSDKPIEQQKAEEKQKSSGDNQVKPQETGGRRQVSGFGPQRGRG